MFLMHEEKPLLREKRTLTHGILSEERHEGSLKQGCISDKTVADKVHPVMSVICGAVFEASHAALW